MPTLTIDGQTVTVPDGTKVIDAAQQLGIVIPRFCFHPALGSVGACRVCAVLFTEGPVKGVQMSCMVEAADGMAVSTTAPEAADFRRQVIEWLMIHHPHDCPVCDEGGHCLLQDMTVSGGHGLRRYEGPKRTYLDQDLGPLVQHEMNRCIHCYRCSRFYREVTGYDDLGVMALGNRTYFGRFAPGPLESPFAGNLSDLCPTGVYTDKPSRYRGRRWDFERTPTLCIGCSLGCHTTTSARYREVVRQEARFSRAVNGWFLCDRGRFGAVYASHADRPRDGRIDGGAATWDESIRAASDRLAAVVRRHGPEAVAGVGSLRNSLETMAMLLRLSEERGWRPPAFWMEARAAANARAAVARLEAPIALSLQEVGGADAVLVVGADPLHEAPMLALSLRQAWRSGARIFVLDDRAVELPLEFEHLPVPPDCMGPSLEALLVRVVDPAAAARCGNASRRRFEALQGSEAADGPAERWVAAAARTLGEARRPAVVCGTEIVGEGTVHLAADAALWLRAMEREAGVFYVLPGPNAFGAALLDGGAGDLEALLDAVEAGEVRALVAVESDPLLGFGDRARLSAALDRLELLIVLDHLPGRTAGRADIFIPTATLYEAGGCYLNQEGRLQASEKALAGGTPVRITGRGDHPPRVYGAGLPGADAKPAWQTLAVLTDREEIPDDRALRSGIWKWLTGSREGLAGLVPLEGIPEEGVRFSGGADPERRFLPDYGQDGEPEGGFRLLRVERIFGTEELSMGSPPLQALEGKPFLGVSAADAKDLGLEDGDGVEVAGRGGPVRLTVSVSARIAPGVLVMPRHRRVDWQAFGSGEVRVRAGDIRKTAPAAGGPGGGGTEARRDD